MRFAALKQPPHSHKTVIENIGKAKKRWKAMAIAGAAVTFSTEGELSGTDFRPSLGFAQPTGRIRSFD